MGKYIQMIVVLVGISLVSGFALGGLNSLTHERAENNVLKFEKIPAVANIYEGYAGNMDEQARKAFEDRLLKEKKTLELGKGKEPMVLFVLKKDGKPYAVTVEQSGKGFAGDIGVMVGFNLETGDLVGIGVTTLSETPGVGSRVKTDMPFLAQFRGMKKDSNFKTKKDGGVIDGVSGATFSSRGVAAAVARAVTFYKENQEKIKQAVLQ